MMISRVEASSATDPGPADREFFPAENDAGNVVNGVSFIEVTKYVFAPELGWEHPSTQNP